MRKNSRHLSESHKKAISLALMGNTLSKGKNLGNKHALGKVSGSKNGNWKGGTGNKTKTKEKYADRERKTYCEICYKEGKTDFDHDHANGKFRGWICRRCNLVLGMVKDNPILLRNLALYIEVNNGYYVNTSLLNTLLTSYAIYTDNGPKKTSHT